MSQVSGGASDYPNRDAVDPQKQVMLPLLMAIADASEKVIIGLIDGPVDAHLSGLSAARLQELAFAPNRPCSLVSSAACQHGTFVAGVRDTAQISAITRGGTENGVSQARAAPQS